MSTEFSDQCIALAGLYQALEQVQHCAREGSPSDQAAVDTVLEAVLRIDAPASAAVFGSVEHLRPGLAALQRHLSRRMDMLRLEQARYGASLMYLERRLMGSGHATAALTAALQVVAMERAERPVSDPWMTRRLADIYVEHVSPLGPRIMVTGEPLHLKTEDNANRIRSLLLAGLRAAVLWRQCGGRRWKLMCFRNAMRRECGALLEATGA